MGFSLDLPPTIYKVKQNQNKKSIDFFLHVFCCLLLPVLALSSSVEAGVVLFTMLRVLFVVPSSDPTKTIWLFMEKTCGFSMFCQGGTYVIFSLFHFLTSFLMHFCVESLIWKCFRNCLLTQLGINWLLIVWYQFKLFRIMICLVISFNAIHEILQ